MSGPEHNIELTDDERQIIDALRESGPLDAIGISSITRLPVSRVLDVVQALKDKGAVESVAPEPVHERVAVGV